MKLRKLEVNRAEKLKRRFRDHPLLLTCQSAFHHYMADMSQYVFMSEDLFLVAAEVIDNIFEDPVSAPQYLEGLWDNVKIELKTNNSVIPPQEDLNAVCKVLFYVVAATLSLHWKAYYNTELVSILYQSVAEKKSFDDAEEQRRIISNLCTHAEALEDWINEYEDNEEWLTDEIEGALVEEQDGYEFPPNTNIFDYKLNEDEIVQTIKKINKKDLGEINFSYAIHSFFESINWLSDKRDTKYVLWMKSHNLMTIAAKNLKQAKPEDDRVVSLISSLHTIFQERHPQTGKWKDKRDFYNRELHLPDRDFINSGE